MSSIEGVRNSLEVVWRSLEVLITENILYKLCVDDIILSAGYIDLVEMFYKV